MELRVNDFTQIYQKLSNSPSVDGTFEQTRQWADADGSNGSNIFLSVRVGGSIRTKFERTDGLDPIIGTAEWLLRVYAERQRHS